MFWFQIFVTFKIGDRPRHFENANNSLRARGRELPGE